jgi:hypothetical protein
MKSINVKMLLGHDIGVSGHYYRPAESDILNDYMTYAAEALTIDPTQRLQKELEQQDLKHSIEWQRLQKELTEIREILDSTMRT